MEDEDDVADGDTVAWFEAVVAEWFDDAIVEDGFVSGVEVDESEAVAAAADFGVFARDAVGVEDDVAFGQAADDRFGFRQLDILAGRWSSEHEETGHALLLRGGGRVS
jgi:hypothetical protein